LLELEQLEEEMMQQAPSNLEKLNSLPVQEEMYHSHESDQMGALAATDQVREEAVLEVVYKIQEEEEEEEEEEEMGR
jgi:hypothetical protein